MAAFVVLEGRTFFLNSARRFTRILDRGDSGCAMSSKQRGDATRSGSSLWIVRGDGALDVVPFPFGDIAGIDGNCRCSVRCRRIRAFARIAIDDVEADEFTVSVVTCEALSS